VKKPGFPADVLIASVYQTSPRASFAENSNASNVLAGAYMRAGMGGHVTNSKSEDTDMWR
jgi:hypothetical protein